MSTPLSRRSVAASAAWSVPVVALSTAAPARAASTHCVPWSPWTVTTEHVQYVGLDGEVGTASFWTVVTPTQAPQSG